MASIERRERAGTVSWRVKWRDPEGKQRSESFTASPTCKRPEKAAKDFRSKIEQQLITGSYVDSGKGTITVGEWAEVWFNSRLNWKESTRDRNRNVLDVHVIPKWGSMPIGKITHAGVQEWVAGMKGAPDTRRKNYRPLSMMLDYAVKDGRLYKNPAKEISFPKVEETERRYLDHSQTKRLAEGCGYYRLMVYFLAYTGIRWGEMAALQVRRLDFVNRRAHITEAYANVRGKMILGSVKNYENRKVPIPPFLMAELRRHVAPMRPGDLVFRGPRGAINRSQKFQMAALNKTAIDMGLCDWETNPKKPGEQKAVNVFHPHELRHTAASLAIASGADVKVVQTMLGHKSATMTLDLYGHLFPDRLDEVADAMDAARTAALAGVPQMFPKRANQLEAERVAG